MTDNEKAIEEERKNRKYDSSLLPVVRDKVDPSTRKDELITLYEQVCSSWHVLIDIRFKLLGFVPAVSVLLIVNLLSVEGPVKGLSSNMKIIIGLLGLTATLGLFIYDKRNSQLHDDLISRGRKIEELWGVDTGQFRGRKDSGSSIIKHDHATRLIYASALIGWAVAIGAIVAGR